MKLQQILTFLGYTIISNNSYFVLLKNDQDHQVLFFRSGESNFSIIDLTSLVSYENSEVILSLLSANFNVDDEVKEHINSTKTDESFNGLKISNEDDILANYLKIEKISDDFRSEYVFKSSFDDNYPNCIVLNGTGKDNRINKNVLFFNNNFYTYLSNLNTHSFKALPSIIPTTTELALTSNPFIFSYGIDNEDTILLFHYQVAFFDIVNSLENDLELKSIKFDTLKFTLCCLTNMKDFHFIINFIVGYMNYTINHYFSVSFQNNNCNFSYHVHLNEIDKHEKYLLLFSKLSARLNLVLKEKYHIDLKENNKFLSKSLKSDTNSIKQIVFPFKMEHALLFVTTIIDVFSLENLRIFTDIQINNSEESYQMF